MKLIKDVIRDRKIEAAKEAAKRDTMRITLEQYIDLLNRFDPHLIVVLGLGPEPEMESDEDMANLEMHVSLDMVKAEEIVQQG